MTRRLVMAVLVLVSACNDDPPPTSAAPPIGGFNVNDEFRASMERGRQPLHLTARPDPVVLPLRAGNRAVLTLSTAESGDGRIDRVQLSPANGPFAVEGHCDSVTQTQPCQITVTVTRDEAQPLSGVLVLSGDTVRPMAVTLTGTVETVERKPVPTPPAEDDLYRAQAEAAALTASPFVVSAPASAGVLVPAVLPPTWVAAPQMIVSPPRDLSRIAPRGTRLSLTLQQPLLNVAGGMVKAVQAYDLFGGLSPSYPGLAPEILLPQGTVWIGQLTSAETSKDRFQVTWTSFEDPAGRTMTVAPLPGSDARSIPGTPAVVDHHWPLRAAATLSTSLVAIAPLYFADETVTEETSLFSRTSRSSTRAEAVKILSKDIQGLGNEYIRETFRNAKTAYVDPGETVTVTLDADWLVPRPGDAPLNQAWHIQVQGQRGRQ